MHYLIGNKIVIAEEVTCKWPFVDSFRVTSWQQHSSHNGEAGFFCLFFNGDVFPYALLEQKDIIEGYPPL